MVDLGIRVNTAKYDIRGFNLLPIPVCPFRGIRIDVRKIGDFYIPSMLTVSFFFNFSFISYFFPFHLLLQNVLTKQPIWYGSRRFWCFTIYNLRRELIHLMLIRSDKQRFYLCVAGTIFTPRSSEAWIYRNTVQHFHPWESNPDLHLGSVCSNHSRLLATFF